uniref:OSJNBa0036B21.3 protein n=1 Tax=Oryza sativa subsp. japonica TaxID=39947 RepID=Q7X689_ORYSJ|nr:OSJNBa0036B21.3 [Oryza sativa Japonica Group]
MGGEEADGGRRSSRALLRVSDGGSAAVDQATAGGQPGRGWLTAGARAMAKPPDLPGEPSSEILLHDCVFHCSMRNAEPIIATGTSPGFACLDPPLSCPAPQGRERENGKKASDRRRPHRLPPKSSTGTVASRSVPPPGSLSTLPPVCTANLHLHRSIRPWPTNGGEMQGLVGKIREEKGEPQPSTELASTAALHPLSA